MRFSSDLIDIPDALRESLSNNNLVVFVGAGVSAQAYPNQKKTSYFPLFNQLVYEIAESLDGVLTSDERLLLKSGGADRVLGDRKNKKEQVHEIASEMLSDSESKRIEVHRSIVRLFPKDAEPRVVTTNFDKLLSLAIEKEQKRAKSWATYEAPCLPPAGSFSGLCYLHGVAGKPESMILTDKDIGRAYMDEGWALKFSHDLFRNFNVLFIGYSLEDPPLRYLALALEGGNTKQHWAFVNCYKRDQFKLETSWKRRGVEPIWYEATRNDHRIVERTLEGWGRENWFQFSDRKNTLIDLGKRKVNHLLPFEIDTARRLFNDEDVLRDFLDSDPDSSWFDILLNAGVMDNILRSKDELVQTSGYLSTAIIRWLLRDVDTWAPIINSFKRTLSPLLFDQFLRKLWSDDAREISKNTIGICMELFRHNVRREDLLNIDYLLCPVMTRLVSEGFINEAIVLFTNYLIPGIKIEKQNNIHYEVAKSMGEDVSDIPEHKTVIELEDNFYSREHCAEGVLNEVIVPNLSEIGLPLLRSLSDLIEESSQRKNLGGDNDLARTYERLPAIEPHKQNEFRDEGMHTMIDITRDTWESLLKKNMKQAQKFRDEWIQSHDPYLERLGIHATRLIVEAGLVD